MQERFRPDIEYRPIPGWPAYMAGSDGSVWSRWQMGPGSGFMDGWRRMRAALNQGGYPQLSLRRYQDKRAVNRVVCVHTLILETFIGPCPEGMVARHFPDRNRTNCAANNLMWGTHQQNCEDRARDGNTAVGERNSNAKITEADVREIRAARGRGAVAAMERRFGLSRASVIAIRKRRTWKHVL